MRACFMSGLCMVFLSGAGLQAIGAGYYVSTTGSNSNAGTPAAPFLTIAYAYSKALAGDTILVQPGNYTEYAAGWGLHLNKSGTASAPITLKSVQRGGAIIDASGATYAQRGYGVYLDGSHNVMDGFKINTSPGAGLRVDGTGNKITNNEICKGGLDTGNGQNGSGIFEGTSGLQNTYAQNYIHDNGRNNYDHGLYLCGDNTTMLNNIVVRNTGAGIQVAGYKGVENIHIYNNTVAYNGSRGIVLWAAQEDGGTTIDSAQIYNNIFAFNGTDGIDGCGPAGTSNVVSNNIVYGNSNGKVNWLACGALGSGGFSVTLTDTITHNPLFVSATDYHLQSGSPGIGAGLTLLSVTMDFDGNARSAVTGYDIGAYQMPKATAALPPISGIKSFRCNTTANVINYVLPKPCFVSIKYYDLLGRTVCSFVNNFQAAGNYSIKLPGASLARNVYVREFRAGDFVVKELCPNSRSPSANSAR
ncbi:MAG: choice-of-anchor Q domain-containing protein [Chitinivibrionales bacterium]|nr:choice-of-anchor Q domain-containing protein [Chitinivibrionales bacterium]